MLDSARFRKWRLLLRPVICRLLVYLAGLFNLNVFVPACAVDAEGQFALTGSSATVQGVVAATVKTSERRF